MRGAQPAGARGPGPAGPGPPRLAVGADARRDRGGAGAGLGGPFAAGAPGAGSGPGAGVAGGPGRGPNGRPGARCGLGKAAVPRARPGCPGRTAPDPSRQPGRRRPTPADLRRAAHPAQPMAERGGAGPGPRAGARAPRPEGSGAEGTRQERVFDRSCSRAGRWKHSNHHNLADQKPGNGPGSSLRCPHCVPIR